MLHVDTYLCKEFTSFVRMIKKVAKLYDDVIRMLSKLDDFASLGVRSYIFKNYEVRQATSQCYRYTSKMTYL